MKKTLVLALALAVGLIGIYSCMSHYLALYNKAYVEILELKEYCQQKELVSNTLIKADSLYTVASKLKDAGKDKEGYYIMELAVIHYRIALSYDELERSKKKNKELEVSLIKAQDKLDTYKKVLSEIESMKQ